MERAGWLVLTSRTADEVVQILDRAPPDVLLLVVTAPSGEELTILDHARAWSDREVVPVICLLDEHRSALVLDAFGRLTDDLISGDPDPAELIARLRTRIERPPVPRSRLTVDPATGALTTEAFEEQLRKEHERVRRGGRPGALAFISFDELPELAARHGSRARDELLAQVVRLIMADGRKLDFVGWRRSMVAILLPSTPTKGAQTRSDRLVHELYDRRSPTAGGRRASDSTAARFATAPIALPVRLFEPDFQRQTTHLRSAEFEDMATAHGWLNETIEPDMADVIDDEGSARPAEPAGRVR